MTDVLICIYIYIYMNIQYILIPENCIYLQFTCQLFVVTNICWMNTPCVTLSCSCVK